MTAVLDFPSEETAENLPVVLVHGFLSESWVTLPVKWRLEEAGFDVHFVPLSPLCVQDVRLLGAQLAEHVNDVLEKTGARRVRLVGLSQGGIIALYYTLQLGGRDRVEQIVTVGTPVRGTWVAAAALPLVGWFSRGVWQMVPISPFLRRLNGMEDLPVSTVSISGDPVCPSRSCRIDGRENRVVELWGGPFKHQFVVLSRRVSDEVIELLKLG